MSNELSTMKTVLRQHADFLRSSFHVGRLGIFGSTARGDQTSASDVDMLVEFIEPVSMFTFLRLEEYLTNTLKKNVDLVTKNALKPAVRDTILQDVLYV